MTTFTSARLMQAQSITRWLVAITVTAFVAVGLTVSGPSAANAATVANTSSASSSMAAASPSFSTDAYEQKVQHWINVRRHQHGLHKLRKAKCVDNLAESWGKHLASKNEFYHQSMQKVLNRCNAYYAGETLGRGSITPRHLVYLWMHSPEHRAVLMSHYPGRVGIGAYPDKFGQWVIAADFVKL